MSREGTVESPAHGTERRSAGLWSDFSFVVSSGYRERTIRALAGKPKLPNQLAKDTGLRLAHVSRALKELRLRGLAECLTPEARARGRLYALTESGFSLVAYLEDSGARYRPTTGAPTATFGFVTKFRASAIVLGIAYLRTVHWAEAVRAALRRWTVNPDQLTERDWISITALDEFYEHVEAAFGDGTYGSIRDMFAHAVPRMPTVIRQIVVRIPLRALAERAPIVYSQEFNYGRLEVHAERRQARFRHYDWSPSPAMCAMMQGTYEGILVGRRVQGTVTKVACVRAGDEYCEYLVEW